MDKQDKPAGIEADIFVFLPDKLNLPWCISLLCVATVQNEH